MALEMAAVLHSQDERVEFLASFNADGEWRSVSSWQQGVRFHRDRLAPLTWRGRYKYLAERFQYRWGFVRNRVAARFASLDPSWLGRFRVEMACDQASNDYTPSPFAGHVVFFQAEESGYSNPEVFWGPIASQGVESVRVPGGNETMFQQPHVRVLARKLGSCLATIPSSPPRP